MRPVVLPLFFLACSGPDLDECEALVLSECDIREADCQEHYSAVIRCLREDDQPTPELEVLSPKAYRARYPDMEGPAVQLTPFDRAFQLLGLEPGDDGGGSSVPAARYDFVTRSVIVVDTGDVRSQMRAISQAHADAATDFLALDFDSDDQVVAAVALFLGETIFYGDAAWYKTAAETRTAFAARLTHNLYYGNEQANAAYLARMPKYDHTLATTAFAVGFGTDAVLAAWLGGGGAAVRAGYDPIVETSAQILGRSVGEPAEFKEVAAPILPAGVTGAVDRLGPWLLHVIQSRRTFIPPDTPIASDIKNLELMAENWRGDVLVVAHDEAADAVGVVLTVALADASGWSPADTTWLTTKDGHEVTLVLAETDDLQAALTAAVRSGLRSRGGASPRRRADRLRRAVGPTTPAATVREAAR